MQGAPQPVVYVPVYSEALEMDSCTCCDLTHIPSLAGAAGPRLFTIHQIDACTNNLPKAHTCFNRIDIPPYESYEKLYEKLLTAIEETCGFAVE